MPFLQKNISIQSISALQHFKYNSLLLKGFYIFTKDHSQFNCNGFYILSGLGDVTVVVGGVVGVVVVGGGGVVVIVVVNEEIP